MVRRIRFSAESITAGHGKHITSLPGGFQKRLRRIARLSQPFAPVSGSTDLARRRRVRPFSYTNGDGENMVPAQSFVNATKASASNSALILLRTRARNLHAQLEDAVNISAALSSGPSYVRLLYGYLNIYRSFEAALQSQVAGIREIVSQTYQSRVPSLERDLRALCTDPVGPHPCRPASRSIPLPDLGEVDSVLGALYVVEGSGLGGQVIYREIQRSLNIDVDSGAAFFFGNGEKTGAAWKRFTALLNERISRPEQAADAAEAMFGAFEYGLRLTADDVPTL